MDSSTIETLNETQVPLDAAVFLLSMKATVLRQRSDISTQIFNMLKLQLGPNPSFAEIEITNLERLIDEDAEADETAPLQIRNAQIAISMIAYGIMRGITIREMASPQISQQIHSRVIQVLDHLG